MKRAPTRRTRATAAWLATTVAAILLALFQAVASAGTPAADRPAGAGLRTVQAATGAGARSTAFDGVVEATRQTVLAAQVSGAVVALNVKAGDRVLAGQVLLRLDARAADQAAAASAAQVRAASAAREAATRDFERQRQLFGQDYISRAALDRAEERFKTAQAEAAAQLASAGAARAQSDFHVVRAPYAGVIADVSVVLGDMALPGRPLLTVYDPGTLRIKAAVPQTAAQRLPGTLQVEAEIPGVTGRILPRHVQLLPTVDPATHTLELRLDLPAGMAGLAPGMFARAWLPQGKPEDARVYVPDQAVLRRAELTAVYVVGADGRALLRQVRIGRTEGERTEILSGVSAGERIALDPQLAAAWR